MIDVAKFQIEGDGRNRGVDPNPLGTKEQLVLFQGFDDFPSDALPLMVWVNKYGEKATFIRFPQ